MLQSDSAHHFAISIPNSLPIQYLLHFSSTTLVKIKTNHCKSTSFHRNVQCDISNRNLGQTHKFFSSKSTLVSKPFIGCSYYEADNFNYSGSWGQVRIILASAPGFDQDSKKDGRPDPLVLQNPSDKEDKGKPSAHVDEDDRFLAMAGSGGNFDQTVGSLRRTETDCLEKSERESNFVTE